MLDPKMLCKQVWTFGRSDGAVVSPAIRLMPSGKIEGVDSKNEAGWRLDGSNLEILTADGRVSSRLQPQSANGRRLSGPYLLAPWLNLEHALTAQLEVRSFNRQLAVLVRTHVVNAKVRELLDSLGAGVDFDLYVAADESRQRLDLPLTHKLSHSVDMCAEIGLSRSIPQGPLLWYMGDYALYCSYVQIPNYNYYLMIEYDVHFQGSAAMYCSQLMNIVESYERRPDLVSIELFERTAIWDNYAEASKHFAKVYGAFFPFVLISRQATEFLFEHRRMAFSKGHPQLFCESFVPSKLAEAGYRIADLNEIVPRSWTKQSFRWNDPLRLKTLNYSAKSILSHPVYDDVEYWPRKMQQAINRDCVDAFTEEILQEQNSDPAWREQRELLLQTLRQHEKAVAT